MTRHQQLLRVIARRPGTTFPELRDSLNLSTGNASKLVAELVESGLVWRHGTRRKYQFYLTPDGAKRIGAAPPTSSIFNLGASQL